MSDSVRRVRLSSTVSRRFVPLARCYGMSGAEQVLELARELVNFGLQPGLWDTDSVEEIIGAERAHWKGHYHGHISVLMGLLWYADTVNDHHLKEFVRAGYEYARNFGITRIGWFPCWIGPNPVGHMWACESCTVADMVALAGKLSTMGVGDYWDDIDGYVRNTLADQQYISQQDGGIMFI